MGITGGDEVTLPENSLTPLYRLVPGRGYGEDGAEEAVDGSLVWASGEEAQLSPFPFLSLFHKMNRSDSTDFWAPWAIFRFVS